jgi:alpha-galactosidase
MFEIGDDLPTLGSEPDRLGLVTNSDLLQMAKLGRVSRPHDLLSYRQEDEQPSVFLLREDERQYMLAVFNWTEQPRSHAFRLSELDLPTEHPFRLYDALSADRPLAFDGETILVSDQPAHSVRLIKIIDGLRRAAPPTVTTQVPAKVKVGEEMKVSASAAEDGVPALAYHWDFGDGIIADGTVQEHTYTVAGTYTVRLIADGVDGVPAEATFSLVAKGETDQGAPRRYVDPTE